MRRGLLIGRRRYRVRPARRREVHVLPQIEKDAARRFERLGFPETFTASTFPLELLEQRQASGQVWVAVDRRDRPVGFATASIIDGVGHLEELSVLPRHGRRGVGSRLVSAVCTWARRCDLRAVTLSTLRSVPWNAPFYTRLGFRVLQPDELTSGLVHIREAEARAGLPVDHRVIMRREI